MQVFYLKFAVVLRDELTDATLGEVFIGDLFSFSKPITIKTKGKSLVTQPSIIMCVLLPVVWFSQ